MSNIGTHRKFGSLELTVFEYFVDMDTVHVHCKRQINMENVTRYPRSFVKHLVANAGMLENKPHSLYYEVPPPFRTIMSLDDNSISIQTFLEWFHRNVNNVYAVIANSATSDFEKVVKLYMDQKTPTADMDQTKNFKRTVAKPFSHRPKESKVDSTDR